MDGLWMGAKIGAVMTLGVGLAMAIHWFYFTIMTWTARVIAGG